MKPKCFVFYLNQLVLSHLRRRQCVFVSCKRLMSQGNLLTDMTCQYRICSLLVRRLSPCGFHADVTSFVTQEMCQLCIIGTSRFNLYCIIRLKWWPSFDQNFVYSPKAVSDWCKTLAKMRKTAVNSIRTNLLYLSFLQKKQTTEL